MQRFHPYCEVFPLLEGAAFEELVADIKKNGLREEIWTFGGLILDGRNRARACQKANIQPRYRQYVGSDRDAMSLVISANIHRRHLNESQRAMAGAELAKLMSNGAADAPADKGEKLGPIGPSHLTDEAAAEAVNVSPRSIRRARKVNDKGSKPLKKAVKTGKIRVSKAAKVVDLPKSEQLKAAQAKPEPKNIPPDEKWVPEVDEEERLKAADAEYDASIAKVMESDDKLSAANAEIKRQAAEIAALKISRNGYMNQCGVLTKRIRALQNENERLKKRKAA